MIKVTDYLIYIKDMNEYVKLINKVNEKFNLKHQYALDRPPGSVTESYNDRVYDTKAIIGNVSIYEKQKVGIEYLINHQSDNKDIYEFIDNPTIAEYLMDKYPTIKQAKKRFDWGYEVTLWDKYPMVRDITSDVCRIFGNCCYKYFNICGREDELEGELLQCPHCNSEIKLELEWIPSLTGVKAQSN